MVKRALVLLYPQNEENEIAIPVAVLRRGGIEVTIAGPTMNPVVGSRGMYTVPEIALCDAMHKGPYDVIVLAGGGNGWRALSEDKKCRHSPQGTGTRRKIDIRYMYFSITMKAHGIMFGKRLTSYPALEDEVREGDKYIYKYADVVVDGNLITSKGNYTTFHWALRTLQYLTDRKTVQEVAKEMLVDYNF